MMCNTCTFRERLYNLKGVGVMVVFQKNILIPNVAKKIILILVEEIFFIWFRQKKFLNETKNHNHPPSS
jgi:phage antirepressor YoqD-like protein